MVRMLDWKRSEDTRDIVHVVVQALVESRLVLVPSETTYLLIGSGLSSKAVQLMMDFPGRMKNRMPSLLLRSSEEVQDYSPEISRVAKRIATRGWPGPLALELATENGASLCSHLPNQVRQHLIGSSEWLSMQVPAHQAINEAMQLVPGPVVAVPLRDCNGKPLIDVCLDPAQQAFEELAYAVDDGPTHFGGLPTGLRIDQTVCNPVAAGVLDRSVLVGLGQLVILLVCTGNTCRSPMAETLLRAQMGERFKSYFGPGLPPPVVAISAGISACPGGSASPEAMAVMQSRGLSLKDHQSRPLTQRLVKQADIVLTMTAAHRQTILSRWPEAASKTFLLSNNGRDVPDPYGGSTHVYATCSEEIDRLLKPWVSQIDESWLPNWTA